MSEQVSYSISISGVCGAKSDVEVLASSIYGDLGDDPVVSMYGYPGFDEVSVVIFIYGDPGDDSQLHIWRDT